VERRDLFRGTLATGLFAVPQLPAKTASAADIAIERHDRLSRRTETACASVIRRRQRRHRAEVDRPRGGHICAE